MDMSIWFLIGAMMVFFMQCGFAMVEAGFTRAKNAGNIIMKNLMDFCIGTIVFVFLGYGLMNGENYFFGFIGMPEYGLFTNFAEFDWSNFFFQLVFCATAATIVSGAMAERTKFSAYCIYSVVISGLIYPIEAGWAWNPTGLGWLAQLGFQDFAGSAVIHMAGGTAALVGAIMLGPRLGKYYIDKNGKKQSRAILGHNLPLGALGVFILWFAWYGFNGAAASDVTEMAKILGTTTIAPAAATVTCLLFTWFKNGKPDVSMCLNAALAGLVAITAPCATVDTAGALIIGIVAGILVVLAVETLDLKLHIDDPVGAVAVHFCNGVWGTIADGLFNTESGLFYGGGFYHLGVQCLGVITICAWVAVWMTVTFTILKKTIGLRCSAEEEIKGLDVTEHGLPSSYADFTINDSLIGLPADERAPMGDVPVEAAIPVTEVSQPAPVSGDPMAPAAYGAYTKITILANPGRFDGLKDELEKIGVTGMTVTQVMGCGTQKGVTGDKYRGAPIMMTLLPKVQIDIVVSTVPVADVVTATKKALYTGNIGDGKIFIYNVENVIRVRTGEQGAAALSAK
ncbi:MAG: ammonium transporter [Oscillospiraceae bacterium]|nr:ammonium transporter [Oscillospiraceae bacterium]